MKLETFADLAELPGIDYIAELPVLPILEGVIAAHPELDGESLLRAGAMLFQVPPHAKIGSVLKVLKTMPLGHFTRLWRHRPPPVRGHIEVAMKAALPHIVDALTPLVAQSRPSDIPMPPAVLKMKLGVLRRRLARFLPEFYRELGVDLSYAPDGIDVGTWLQQKPPHGPSTNTRKGIERLGARVLERMGGRTVEDDERLYHSGVDAGIRHLLSEYESASPPPEALRRTGAWRLDKVMRTVTLENAQLDACLTDICDQVTCSFANPRQPVITCPNSRRTPCTFKRFMATRLAEMVYGLDSSTDPSFVEAVRGFVRADGADILLARLTSLDISSADKPEGATVGWLFTEPDKLEAVWVTEKKKGGLKTKKIPKGQVRHVLTHPLHHAVQSMLEVRYSGTRRAISSLVTVGPALAMLAHERAVYLGGDEVVPLKIQVHEPRLAPILEGEYMRFEVALGPIRMADDNFFAGEWLAAVDPRHTLHVGVVTEALAEGLMSVRGLERIELQEDARSKVAEGLLALSAKVPLAADGSWLGERQAIDHRWVLKLELSGHRGSRRAVAELGIRIVPELGVLSPCEGPETLPLKRPDADGVLRVAHVVRDLPQEQLEAIALWEQLGLGLMDGLFLQHIEDLESALALVACATDLAHAGQLEIAWASSPMVVKKAKAANELNLKIGVRRDWLDLQGGFKFDGGELPLKELLEALRHNKRYIEVNDTTMVELDDGLRRALMPLSSLAREQSGKVVASPLAVPLVEELERSGVELDAPPEWFELTDKLDEAVALVPELPPLEATLRPYQTEGHAWVMRLAHWARGACLADDMGLGKTLQALAVIASRAAGGPTLVIAPTSVVPNWVRETRRFAPQLRVKRVLQGGQLDEVLLGLEAHVVLVTSWDLLVRHEARLVTATTPEGAVPWRTVVLDEAQAMKNPTTKRAQVARSIEREFALLLTGTPVENRPLELWSLMSVVAPGLLGSAENFRDRFARPIEERRPDAARQLARIVRPFILRRTKGEVARDLPQKSEIRVDVILTEEERERYQRIRHSAIKALRDVDSTPAQKRIRMLAVLTRLRQLACHPRLVDPKAPHTSSKLERLIELAEELAGEGRKMLVFSQFTELLSLVREAFEAANLTYTYLDGSTPGVEREKAIARFQSGEVHAFLLSLKAGGVGLNLTTATEVIHLDPWWNPAVEDQASDRAHRIGQDKPVTVYRMVALGTIEEQILTLHADKRMMMASLLEGTDSAAPISSDEMLALLMDAEVEEESPEAAAVRALELIGYPKHSELLSPSAPSLTLSPPPVPSLTLPLLPAPGPVPSHALPLFPTVTPAPTPAPPTSSTLPLAPTLPLPLAPTASPTLPLAPAPPSSTDLPLSPALPQSSEDLLKRVFAALESAPDGLSKSDLLAVTGVPDPLWPDFRRLLSSRPEIDVTGSTRATRYHLRR